MGGDLYHLKFPDNVTAKKRTMLIGIDVCHAGPQSIVGIVASTNQPMSQYFSEHLIQKKGQEVVKDKMVGVLRRAIEVFAKNHKGEIPTNIVIYRDGVGDSQMAKVISREVCQLEEAIE